MKKQDLKNKMVVECKNGERFIVIDDLLFAKDGFNRLCEYNDDLYTITENYRIDKVYSFKAYGEGYQEIENKNSKYLELLWERKELPQLSKDEKTILEAVVEKTKAKYIARDYDGELYVYKSKPEKKKEIWIAEDYSSLLLDYVKNLFKSIKWEDEEPYYIPDLLLDK